MSGEAIVFNGTEFYRSSGNIFEDLGDPDADEKFAKMELAYKINALIEERRLTQQDAAKILGITQPQVSLLSRGRLSGFSLEKLFRLLNRLDREVEIVVRPREQAHRPITVSGR